MIAVGDVAPAFEAVDGRGRTVRLADFRGRKVVLRFLRHTGCPICRMETAILMARHHEVTAKAELVVLFDAPQGAVAPIATRDDCGFTVIGDPERRVYGPYGVERGGLLQFAAPGAAWKATRATLAGHLHGRTHGSELQLPADFVVGEDGRVLLAHRGAHIGDNLPFDDLIRAL